MKVYACVYMHYFPMIKMKIWFILIILYYFKQMLDFFIWLLANVTNKWGRMHTEVHPEFPPAPIFLPCMTQHMSLAGVLVWSYS